jgi:DNA-binding NarL/FixJ family response regulator
MPAVARNGRYSVVWSAQAGTATAQRALPIQIVYSAARLLEPRAATGDVVVLGTPALRGALSRALAGPGTRVVGGGVDDAFDLAASPLRDVRVTVVDLQLFGLDTVRDLHAVFPEVKIVALSSDPRLTPRATFAGAAVALPRSTPPAEVAKAAARLLRR